MKRNVIATRLMLTVSFAMAAGSAAAQDFGRAKSGQALATQVCAQCHAVESGLLRSPNAEAPRFEAIAKLPGMTSIALNAALQTSHRSMPNVILEADARSDIVAYILSLK